MGFKMVYRCDVCQAILENEDRKSHLKMHIANKDVFSAPCKLNGKPSTGVCILKEHYDSCRSPPMRNNWMCWRDEILIEP